MLDNLGSWLSHQGPRLFWLLKSSEPELVPDCSDRIGRRWSASESSGHLLIDQSQNPSTSAHWLPLPPPQFLVVDWPASCAVWFVLAILALGTTGRPISCQPPSLPS